MKKLLLALLFAASASADVQIAPVLVSPTIINGNFSPAITGTGTVTSVSVATANGLSGTVTNPTTTPAITLSANSAILPVLNTAPGVTTITSAGGTTALTAASTMYQRVIGTANQTITLPDQTTIPAGTAYVIDSDTTGIVTVKDSAGTTLATGLNGNAGYIYSMSNATATGNWGGYAFVPAGMTFPTAAATLARTDAGQTFTGDQAITGKLTVGSGANSVYIQQLVGSPTFSAFYSGGVTPSAVNAFLSSDPTYTVINSNGSTFIRVANNNIITATAAGAAVTGTLSSTAAAKLSSGFTVAGLATCNAAYTGYRSYVTDALAPTFLGVLTGGGTVVTPVFCNGTAWVAH